MFVRAYLRASTKDQDANRARAALRDFTSERGLKIASWYVETASGAKLERPQLFRLLEDAEPGDVLLVEQVDRLSRLARADWAKLKTEIGRRGVRVVAMDVPTSHGALSGDVDGFMSRVLDAITAMLIDILAAMAAKDYTDRRRRAAQGIEKARAAGKYRGRPENAKRNAAIMSMLDRGMSWNAIIDAMSHTEVRLSRSTLSRLVRRRKGTTAQTTSPMP